jgi:hypothetical protein
MLFALLNVLYPLGGAQKSSKPMSSLARRLRRALPRVEALEDRLCPANLYEWIGPAGGDGLWSNPHGTNWNVWDPTLPGGAGWVLAAANQYPGMAGSGGDGAAFDNVAAGPATLDVPLIGANSLDTLGFTGWRGTLTLSNSLLVDGGSFSLTDGSTITLATDTFLTVSTNPSLSCLWSRGTITGTDTSTFYVSGCPLYITQGVGASVPRKTLGTKMVIMASPVTGDPGSVTLTNMTDNLLLTGSAYIDVGNGGHLDLFQAISAPGVEGSEGGLVTRDVPAVPAVQVEPGGTLYRNGAGPWQGIVNQVEIDGPIYNLGGTVSIETGSLLNIAGQDSNGYAYWQENSSQASLQVASGANIAATDGGTGKGPGTFEIDGGTVQLTAPSGGSADELDGAGLTFNYDGIPESLAVVDSTPGTPGTVTVQGPVTLSAFTKTTLNFTGGNNTSDLLDVQNGALKLNGTLILSSVDGNKPTRALNVFDDKSPLGVPSMTGSFIAISDNVNPLGNDAGKVVTNNPQLLYFQVSFGAPVVGAITPNKGTTDGGTVVTITGSNLDWATAVSFGGVAATSFTVNADGSITATAPPAAAGIVDVTVTSSQGTSATSPADQFTYVAPPPAVMGISPSSGSVSGGTTVTISGSHFTGATAVYFGGTAAASFTVNSDNTITAVSPAGSPGTVDITIVTASGTSATEPWDQFTYTSVPRPMIMGISPSSGPATGGTSVTIYGYALNGATAVYFGTTAATNFTVNADGSIIVVSPPGLVGTVDITAVTAGGTSTTSPYDQFTYT